ncbi:WhiB family transcriptional regulator [Streptomyces sp. NA04227]|uniref:WhiB family transcriptional regulator n=1 Tax=Streptomyces sp. NA04227 TaxID=2742136 RepID=UPI001590CE43|nr:WhiB family transcriptional regulator [Streptomyces sp. NA04227]QKW07002.1 WhiB family transcriptional regulator [Streptomyces sp. NA04227]
MPRPSRYAPDNLPRPYHWTQDAACAGEPTALFFPAGTSGAPIELDVQYAKTFCNRCLVRDQCLTHAMTYREDYGVWGGLDERERAEMIRQARLEAERRRRREREERARASAAA